VPGRRAVRTIARVDATLVGAGDTAGDQVVHLSEKFFSKPHGDLIE
jgi:hypothetical protein